MATRGSDDPALSDDDARELRTDAADGYDKPEYMKKALAEAEARRKSQDEAD